MPELHKLQRGRHVIWTQSCMKLLGFKVFRSYGTVLKALAFWCFKTTLSKVFENLLMPLDPFVLRLIVEIIILQGFFSIHPIIRSGNVQGCFLVSSGFRRISDLHHDGEVEEWSELRLRRIRNAGPGPEAPRGKR